MNMNKAIDLQLFAAEIAEEAPGTEQTAVPREEAPQDPFLRERFLAHLEKLEDQARALKAVFPGFDLRKELENPVFRRLTAPGVGLSVEDAFYAVHRRELQNATVQAATRLVSQSIASGARRPQENGLNAQAPAVSRFDYRHATKEQREELKRQIRQAAAEGKKLYPRS